LGKKFPKSNQSFVLYPSLKKSGKKYTQKQTWSYTHLHVEHVCNSETTLWNSGEEGKEKLMTESTTLNYIASL
jgi:hypothetical protein